MSIGTEGGISSSRSGLSKTVLFEPERVEEGPEWRVSRAVSCAFGM